MQERLEFAVDHRWGALERHQKSHASADGLATAQQEILQQKGVAFAISAVNLCVLVEAAVIVSSCMFFARVLSAREEAARSVVDRRS